MEYYQIKPTAQNFNNSASAENIAKKITILILLKYINIPRLCLQTVEYSKNLEFPACSVVIRK